MRMRRRGGCCWAVPRGRAADASEHIAKAVPTATAAHGLRRWPRAELRSRATLLLGEPALLGRAARLGSAVVHDLESAAAADGAPEGPWRIGVEVAQVDVGWGRRRRGRHVGCGVAAGGRGGGCTCDVRRRNTRPDAGRVCVVCRGSLRHRAGARGLGRVERAGKFRQVRERLGRLGSCRLIGLHRRCRLVRRGRREVGARDAATVRARDYHARRGSLAHPRVPCFRTKQA